MSCPHSNVPGSERSKRWEDVIALQEAGIDVAATMNIQHLESLNDQVCNLAGVRVRETVPDWVIREASEVVMVDLTPRALLNRLMRGAVYPADKTRRAMEHFFKESTLVALRELALRETAHEVNVRFIDMTARLPGTAPDAAREERILACLTVEDSAPAVIRRARRVADYLGAECWAAYVAAGGTDRSMEPALNFARNLHLETRILEGADPAVTLIEFARVHRITQIFVSRPHYSGLRRLLGRHPVHRIVRLARDMEVTVVATREPRAKRS